MSQFPSFRLYAHCAMCDRRGGYFIEVDEAAVTAASMAYLTRLLKDEGWTELYGRLYCGRCQRRSRRRGAELTRGGR